MEANNKRYHQYGKVRTSYVEGNTARKLNAVPDIRREEQSFEIPSRRRQEHRYPRALTGMNIASLFVLTIAIVTTLYVCVDYLKLQYNVSRMEKNIITLEHTLTTLSNSNDAAYEQINTAYDLGYVYQVAVEELGMVYPDKNTVITYQSSEDSYIRQFEDIPE
ncbi:cell division protein FtsL [Mobilitalea sibirica]|uniref:Cell division protein FtsL n=2 Tax=Mobilitalea sibirica TaxID=1462919 RepID=A0A8J7KTG6_9FIRM|nr:cell division protein FtsL [Mobilitalea sibirica]